MADLSPQWPTGEAQERLSVLLELPRADQDWEIINADASRVAEFCDAYEIRVLDREGRFALMGLIVASYDDYLSTHPKHERNAALEERVQSLLLRDFQLHRHTIEYWCKSDVTDDEEDWDNPEWVFVITPLMRCVWSQCQASP